MKTETYNQQGAASSEDIYRLLRHRIISFDISPGDTLSENLLAEHLRVSRAPVREAMARLVEEGLVVVYPQRGSAATLLDPERVRQSIFLHVTLERAIIAELARKGLTSEQIHALEDCLDCQRSMGEDESISTMMEEDERMHALFYDFAGHSEAEEVFRTVNGDQLRVRYLQLRTFSYSRRVQLSAVAGWENSLLEHRMLLDALKKNDEEAACLVTVNHINAVLWYADNLLKIFPQYFLVRS